MTVAPQDGCEHPRLLGHRAVVQREAPLAQRSLGTRQDDDRHLRGLVDVWTQRNCVVGYVRAEDDQAALVDQLVKGPLDRFVRAVGQADDIALHQIHRTVDEAGFDCLVENHPDRVERVVVGVRPRRIVVEEAHFQRYHGSERSDLLVSHTCNLQHECCYDR